MNRRATVLYALVVPALLTVADQGTKRLAVSLIPRFDKVEILPWLNLVNVRNEGAAFGLFSGLGNWFFIAVSFVAIAALLYMIIRGDEGGGHRLGFAIILGGAVGNLTDRLVLGYVVDFVDVHAAGFHWPAFNVADLCLSAGLFVIIVGSLLDMKRAGAAKKGN